MSHTHNHSYYEAILQLRPANKKLLDFVVKRIKERGNVSISKTVKLKTGVDLYLSSWRFAVSLSRMLKKSFGGTTKITRKLHTQSKKTGKRVYRVTVLFRL